MVTVITKTIGAGGGYDYATFAAAETDVTNIGTSADLVANDEAIVFEAAAGDYPENFQFYTAGALTCDATRNVTWTHASGAGHGGQFESGVNIIGYCLIQEAYAVVDGLSVSPASGDALSILLGQPGIVAKNMCLFSVDAEGATLSAGGTVTEPAIVQNCNIKASGRGMDIRSEGVGDSYWQIVNNTVVSTTTQAFIVGLGSSDTLHLDLVNNLVLGTRGYFAVATGYTLDLTGSNNFGPASNALPGAIQGTPYPITATTDVDPGPGDWAIYDAATGALIDDPDNDVLAGGIGPDANPDVPTTDILGNTRSGATTDPGAFEVSTLAPPEPALITIMRQIYQQDASFSVGASSAGVEKITHQLGPGSADFFTINSSTSATVSVPRTAHALRVICVVAGKACDVTLDLDASNSVFLGSIGGVASVQTDLTYFWSFGQVVSDGTYPRVRIVNDGFAGDQNVYLWWHLA
jgi:hypothetical protein